MYTNYYDMPLEDQKNIELVAKAVSENFFIRLPFQLSSFSEEVQTSIQLQFLDCCDIDEDGAPDERPIMEYWLILNSVYKQALMAIGEPIAEIDNAAIWGRRTSGVSLKHDLTIMKMIAVSSGKLEPIFNKHLFIK